MRCRCLATAPKKWGQSAYLDGLCLWCRSQSEECNRDHRRNAIAAIWSGTYPLMARYTDAPLPFEDRR